MLEANLKELDLDTSNKDNQMTNEYDIISFFLVEDASLEKRYQ